MPCILSSFAIIDDPKLPPLSRLLQDFHFWTVSGERDCVRGAALKPQTFKGDLNHLGNSSNTSKILVRRGDASSLSWKDTGIRLN